MMVAVLEVSMVWVDGMGALGSGSQAGVCSAVSGSESELEASWGRVWAASKMEEEQGWIPAVV